MVVVGGYIFSGAYSTLSTFHQLLLQLFVQNFVIYKECYLEFQAHVVPEFQAVRTEKCHSLHLDACAKRLVTENCEFDSISRYLM